MRQSDLERIWERDILPVISVQAVPDRLPTTVFLGGQPAAGKTRAQRILTRLCRELPLPIVGDDFRRFHPDYESLIRTSPLSMPYETAQAAGYWTGRAVEYADVRGVSCIIEGTWRDSSTVSDEAARAKSLGRRARAVLLAVPPVLSRIGLLSRFYWDVHSGRPARWTPPEAHEATVSSLPVNVRKIAFSGLFDDFSVMDRSGQLLYDGADPESFVSVWLDRFAGPLAADELEAAERDLESVLKWREGSGIGMEETRTLLSAIKSDLEGMRPSVARDGTPSARPRPRSASHKRSRYHR